MKPIARWVIALALVTAWTPLKLWAQQDEREWLKQARITKHQAKKIALSRVRRGAIKCVEFERENGVLIWSVDLAQSRKKDLTDVWIDATTGKITAVELETPLTEKQELAEQKARKWVSHHDAN